MQIEDDFEKLEFYKKAKFFLYEDVIYSNITFNAKNQILELRKNKKNKKEIELFLNHFHLSAISSDINKQREIAFILAKTWRAFMNETFPDKTIVIETQEYPQEVIVYIYQY